MASSMIHLAIVQEMRKNVSFRDINRLFLGVILPDGAVAGNSHLKKKICENTRYTYDLEFFRDRYGKYMKKDDLYLGYYLHLIQDMLYRRVMYGEHGWNSSVPGNVEKLHRDYEILNEYVSKKYSLSQEMIQELDLTKEPLAQLAEFDVKGLIKEVRREFTQRKKEKLFILTRQMADEYIVRATEFCVEELKALSKGKSRTFTKRTETCRKQECSRHIYECRPQAYNVGCMKPWMNYEPRSLKEILSFKETAETGK